MSAAPDGTPLACYHWPAAPQPGKAVEASRGIYLLHGLSEYAGRYEHVAGWLAARGWRVAAHDHRGHGRSGGKRATLQRADDLMIDAESRIAAFAEELGAPPVLLGHSMGGLVAAQVALANRVPLRGLVLSSPAFQLALGAAPRLLLRLLMGSLPDLRIPHVRREVRLTHDQAVVRAYLEDPLVNQQVTARLVQFIYEGGPAALAQAGTLPVRTLLLVAGADVVVDSAGSRAFADAAPPGRLALRWYDTAWHEVLNETPEIARPVYADLDAWLADA